jgi:hypothetical protein
MSAAANAAGYLFASGRLRTCHRLKFDSELQALMNAPPASNDPSVPRVFARRCLSCTGKWHLITDHSRVRR